MEETKKKSGLSTAGLVLGIIGVCTSFLPIINNLSFVMGVLAIIFGFIAFIKRAGKVKNIIVILLGILAIYMTISSQEALSNEIDTAFGGKTEEILANSLDVKIGDFKVEEDEYLTDTKLVITVKNKTTETKSFSVKIEAVDKDGTRIEDDVIYANDLKAGQSQKIEAFNLVSSDKIKELKKAKFNIVEVSMY